MSRDGGTKHACIALPLCTAGGLPFGPWLSDNALWKEDNVLGVCCCSSLPSWNREILPSYSSRSQMTALMKNDWEIFKCIRGNKTF